MARAPKMMNEGPCQPFKRIWENYKEVLAETPNKVVHSDSIEMMNTISGDKTVDQFGGERDKGARSGHRGDKPTR
jgi:hypothetical protein